MSLDENSLWPEYLEANSWSLKWLEVWQVKIWPLHLQGMFINGLHKMLGAIDLPTETPYQRGSVCAGECDLMPALIQNATKKIR